MCIVKGNHSTVNGQGGTFSLFLSNSRILQWGAFCNLASSLQQLCSCAWRTIGYRIIFHSKIMTVWYKLSIRHTVVGRYYKVALMHFNQA